MTFDEFKSIIEEGFPEISAGQLEQFRMMEALYRDWN
jgi:hypothetical protein